MRIHYQIQESPVGDLFTAELEGDPVAIWFRRDTTLIDFLHDVGWTYPEAELKEGGCSGIREWLKGYFAGRPPQRRFPRYLRGTPFQIDVWREIARIPFGATRTYGEIAQRLGTRGGSRAVGGATGKNPVSILIPCHRVIGTRGQLTGFGGGLPAKIWLLRHEGCRIPGGSVHPLRQNAGFPAVQRRLSLRT
ncbi:MAG: methylated-DNA--[protein]-cysteine S-methyltransferase [Candidatus Eisenbacteria bacterium]|nr:methylated-DNA--[protein]-cysteine S-methyltransferase [Candidatus Eisenbacteria bacterium]